MNALQEFMARGNVQSVDTNQELFEMDGSNYYGTFGDSQIMPVMTINGYQDHLVTPLKVSRVQFAAAPESRQKICRPLTGRTLFIQVVDFTNPVVFTFILTDREL